MINKTKINYMTSYLKINGTPVEPMTGQVEEIIQTEGIKTIEATIQHGPVKEVGVNGIQMVDLLRLIEIQYQEWKRLCPCVQTDAILSSFQTIRALEDSRTEERKSRGVEGTSEK